MAKGINLSYITPVMKNEEKVIDLKKEETDKATEEWKQALILYVVGESPTIAVMERYIALQVNTVSKPKVYYHNDGYFLVRFDNMDDKNEVLYSEPHFLNNRPIIVKVWSPEFDFNKEVLQTIPIWSMDSLSRINSGLGEALYADECTTKVDRISFARVLIEMDVARELPRKLKVEDPNGRRKETKWQPKVDASKTGDVKVLEEQVAAPREETWKQNPSKAARKIASKSQNIGTKEKVEWRSLVWTNFGAPKWLFTMYLAVKGRLATKDRLAKWGIIKVLTFPLCQLMNEDHDHIFFQCAYETKVWRSILHKQGITRSAMNWTNEIQWAIQYMKGRSNMTFVCRIAMANTIYHTWLERNTRIFQQKQQSVSSLIRHIIHEIHGRGIRYPRIATRLHNLNTYP
ncbi:hypothetical protein RDI58_029107 [Solanum bulbocastanum]|uniref:DUF4283 domain-containing protein n=1 Tax=Solanum bulbocastanum TaxID=147425 RepID=A0AAN8SR50_SOLBU